MHVCDLPLDFTWLMLEVIAAALLTCGGLRHLLRSGNWTDWFPELYQIKNVLLSGFILSRS